MKERIITIEIDEHGAITADAEGFAGTTCLDELEKLLADLGFEEADIKRKEDVGERRVALRRTQRLGGKR